MRRLPLAPILAVLLAEALAGPLDLLVGLFADAPYVRILPGTARAGGILDSGTTER